MERDGVDLLKIPTLHDAYELVSHLVLASKTREIIHIPNSE
jgi:hypothetical protein